MIPIAAAYRRSKSRKTRPVIRTLVTIASTKMAPAVAAEVVVAAVAPMGHRSSNRLEQIHPVSFSLSLLLLPQLSSLSQYLCLSLCNSYTPSLSHSLTLSLPLSLPLSLFFSRTVSLTLCLIVTVVHYFTCQLLQ